MVQVIFPGVHMPSFQAPVCFPHQRISTILCFFSHPRREGTCGHGRALASHLALWALVSSSHWIVRRIKWDILYEALKVMPYTQSKPQSVWKMKCIQRDMEENQWWGKQVSGKWSRDSSLPTQCFRGSVHWWLEKPYWGTPGRALQPDGSKSSQWKPTKTTCIQKDRFMN